MNNTNTPQAEAKVQVRTVGEDWCDSLDFDPIMIPVESDGLTDAFDANVYALTGVILDIEAGFSEHRTDQMTEYNLVWSASGATVKALCPVCDDVFPVAEGAPGDELNEGYDAVWCGCDPTELTDIDPEIDRD